MHKTRLFIYILFLLTACNSEDSMESNSTIERLTIGNISPSRARVGEIVTVNGTRMDLIQKITFFNELQVGGEFDHQIQMTKSGFMTQTEEEISFVVPYFYHDKMMIDFHNTDNTVKELELKGWIPTLHDFESINLIEAPSNKVGFLHDGNNVYRSVDGFLSWDSVFESSNYVGHIFFIDELTGWIVEKDFRNIKFHLTEDGGSSFNLHFEMILDYSSGIRNVEFVSRNKGFIVDGEQNMYVFENGEVKDLMDYYPEFDADEFDGEGIDNFRVLDENTLFLDPYGAGNSTMYKLSNGRLKDLGFENHLTFPQIIEEIGYCMGSNNKLYKSFDGGDSWSELVVFEGPYSSVHFLDKNHGFVKTGREDDKAKQLETIDGGLTWKESLIDLQFPYGLSVVNSPENLIGPNFSSKLFRFIE
ncbi:MAG: hypothetical protein JSV73_05930 [Flavobacteriaceae bacterium]|nr:MAG: hypothetical protein JSV73_05930 [Flavobacteriaceae bacterium]